ncbi:MAG: hypothetical protein LCI00_00215 [Chloroflexi bacterium]|nr:hypothetical protein [Chloroflexota bacterium]MCC6894361.1 hypothetical protein [Anaerolineae bacterium]
MQEKKVIKAKKENGSRQRLWLVVLFIGITIALCMIYVVIPFLGSGGGMADTRPVPGDAARFDPVAGYAGVLDHAGTGAQLVGIDAYYVRSDGTMDLTATYSPAPHAEYNFMRELSEPPPNAPPIGAGGANTDPWYEPVEIELSKPGQWWSVSSSSGDYSYVNQGMMRDVNSAVNGLSSPVIEPPACSFADLWAIALTKDAPAEAVAIIEYDVEGYDFSISGLSINLEFGMDCKLKAED